ncbi:hypothetical protein [Virgibacillus halodenitrificans]|uniref:hypothetical protein n=1 Tax=Virgibacillus halodenitrificans TaxID=1482 RepID=UPI0003177FA7|nr:hypothetical protein [Virgibacillus halodenitrificans]MCJ0932634.1 hypothetical protein [Virgibacillus halodenitrificans]
MKKNHLVTLTEWRYWEGYEEHEWLGGAMSYLEYDAYKDTPSKQECDRICEEKSGEITSYKIK